MPACLVSVQNGSLIVVDKAVMLVGRQPECDIVLPNSRKISRMHCCIAQVDSTYLIRDLASMNGVRVNGVRVRESRIQEGDQIAIGDICFVFEFREKTVQPRNAASRPPANVDRPRNKATIPNVSQQYSEEYPVAISESSRKFPLEAFTRETPMRPPPIRKKEDSIVELDSGEIHMRDLSDSGV